MIRNRNRKRWNRIKDRGRGVDKSNPRTRWTQAVPSLPGEPSRSQRGHLLRSPPPQHQQLNKQRSPLQRRWDSQSVGVGMLHASRALTHLSRTSAPVDTEECVSSNEISPP